jgi:hypothetical protein
MSQPPWRRRSEANPSSLCDQRPTFPGWFFFLGRMSGVDKARFCLPQNGKYGPWHNEEEIQK